MSNEEATTVCPYCGNPVDPRSDGVVYGVLQYRLKGKDGDQIVQGAGRFFHPGCPPFPAYVPRPLPGDDPTIP
jgi:hypothetical protein